MMTTGMLSGCPNREGWFAGPLGAGAEFVTGGLAKGPEGAGDRGKTTR
jgi:hypothetical protein